jgi:hypothetical protein
VEWTVPLTNTHPSLFTGVGKKIKDRHMHNSQPSKDNVWVCCSVCILFAETLWWQLLLFFLQLLETWCSTPRGLVQVVEQFWYSYQLKGLEWRVFYSWGNPTNLRNCKVWTHEKRGMNVYIVTETVLTNMEKRTVSINLI